MPSLASLKSEERPQRFADVITDCLTFIDALGRHAAANRTARRISRLRTDITQADVGTFCSGIAIEEQSGPTGHVRDHGV